MAPAARQWEKLSSTWVARLVDVGKEEVSRTAAAAAESSLRRRRQGPAVRGRLIGVDRVTRLVVVRMRVVHRLELARQC